jgi:hypothetical protein
MTEVLSALLPPAAAGGVFIYGVVKLLRSEAAGRRANQHVEVPGA